MKYLLTLLSATVLLCAIYFSPAYAAIGVSWTATSTDVGYINPSRVNGNDPFVQAAYFKATSTTASTFNSVGVGTTSPWGQLSVNPNGITGPSFVVGSSTGTSLIVTNSGRLGMGTTAPQDLADFQSSTGNATFGLVSPDSNARFVAIGYGDAGTLSGGMTFQGARGTAASPTATKSGDRIGIFGAKGHTGTSFTAGSQAAVQFFASQDWSVGNVGTYETFSTTPSNSGSLTEALRIDSTQFIGIGSTTPWAQLSVNPNLIGTGPEFSVGSSTGTNLIVTNAGNVGTGTTSPSAQLAVNATSGLSPFAIGNASGEAVRLTASGSGNVGIGTTSPFAKLSVTGAVAIDNSSANAFQVGAQGSGVTAFSVNNTTSGTGISVTSAAAASGAAVAVTSTGTNESLTIDAKGSGTITLNGTATGNISTTRLINASSGFSTNSTVTNSNFSTTGIGSVNNTVAQYQLLGSTNMGVRTAFYGSTASTLTAGSNYASVLVANTPITEAASSNHPLLTNLAVRNLLVTAGVSTVSTTSSLYIEDAATTTVSSGAHGGNFSLYVANGETWLNGTTTTGGRTYMTNLTTSAGLQGSVICGSTSTGGEIIADSVSCLASAARYKENVQTLATNLDQLRSLRPVQFTWKKDFNKGFENDPNKSGVQYSLIADEVAKVDPRLASYTLSASTFEGKTYPAGSVQGLADANHWIAEFVGWLQQILARQDAQEKRIDALEATVKAQQAQIDALKHK